MEQKDPVFQGNEYLWDKQSDVVGEDLEIDQAAIINISDKMDKDGILTWDVPEGEWIIQRIGMTPTNIKDAPVFAEAEGLEADKLNAKAIQSHFDNYIGKIMGQYS